MEKRKIKRERKVLREVIVKISLERIDIQEGIIVKVFLDSRVISLVMSLEFARKKRFKLKKIEKPIYMRNVDKTINKNRLIKHSVKINIYYQVYRK